ncbi:hypothetical protein K0M31_016099 [Melipona bicolor]|uniref:Uncharacterized protein n=1 Tax=Melipona bicolor TaxID=60889 RepID=A0AA40G6H3_9HYME|nr:hypothetical protein K0M31_016099 [Melipona bicolor]
MSELEERMKVIEGKEREETEKGKKVENRITAIERKLKRKEREEKRRNIVIKIICNEKKKEKVVERILARIGEKVKLESISMGDKERLEDDLTEREKKMQRELRKIAVIERKKGKRIWFKYGKIQTDDVWWRWDEEEKVLKIWRGIRRMEEKQDEKKKGR